MNKFKIIAIFLLLIVSSFIFDTKQANAIKIGLQTNVKTAMIGISNNGGIFDGLTGKLIMQLNALRPYNIKKIGTTLGITINGQTYPLGTNFAVIKTYQSGYVSAKRKWYRGQIYIYNNYTGVIVVNNISLEDYLLGVVPSEMPRTWNYEAHKAQAIAARSYAVANLGKRKKYGYDLKDTPEDQAYGGASSESLRTNKAVVETSGQVLIQGNRVIPAFYCASAGGYTLNSGDVWMRDLPYLKSVPSFDGAVRKMGHGIGMSQYGANNMANLGYNAYQILGYFYKDVKLYRISVSL
ncbi:MAG: SpoIID/LytB domain-containing protein [bacterium]